LTTSQVIAVAIEAAAEAKKPFHLTSEETREESARTVNSRMVAREKLKETAVRYKA
jgi:hypothetical protein